LDQIVKKIKWIRFLWLYLFTIYSKLNVCCMFLFILFFGGTLTSNNIPGSYQVPCHSSLIIQSYTRHFNILINLVFRTEFYQIPQDLVDYSVISLNIFYLHKSCKWDWTQVMTIIGRLRFTTSTYTCLYTGCR
jgi:hypothetical protein